MKCSHELLPQKYTRFGSVRLPVDDRGNLYWHLGNWSQDMERFEQIALIASVFMRWNKYFIPWEFKSTADFNNAQWYIYWVRNNVVTMPNGETWNTKERGLFDFQKNPSTLAVEFASPNLLCLINDDIDYSFTTAGPNAFDLATVLLHELGHGFQLGHTDKAAIDREKAKGNTPIMGAYYDRDATITDDEAQAIWDIHSEHLFEFSKHPTILRLKRQFGDNEPQPLRRKTGCWGKILGL